MDDRPRLQEDVWTLGSIRVSFQEVESQISRCGMAGAGKFWVHLVDS